MHYCPLNSTGAGRQIAGPHRDEPEARFWSLIMSEPRRDPHRELIVEECDWNQEEGEKHGWAHGDRASFRRLCEPRPGDYNRGLSRPTQRC
jgi:hypothetical protein